MPRALKPHKVDFVTHPGTQQHLDIFFDRDKKEFFASIGMHRVESTDAVAIRKLALDLLTKVPVYEWKPVIVVDRIDLEEGGGHHYRVRRETDDIDVELRFKFYRCEIAKDPMYKGPETKWDPKERWYERKHTLDFEDWLAEMDDRYRADKRKEREQNRHLDRHHQSDSDSVLPYDEKLWNGLHRIVEILNAAKGQLSMLIDSKDLEARLLTVQGGLLLPPAAPIRKRSEMKR